MSHSWPHVLLFFSFFFLFCGAFACLFLPVATATLAPPKSCLQVAVEALTTAAVAAVEEGADVLVLSDKTEEGTVPFVERDIIAWAGTV